METPIKELRGSSIVKLDLLEGTVLETEVLTLQDLAGRKKYYTDKISSLHSSLAGMQQYKLATIIDIHKRITALQYNLLFIKLRIATLNVGIPDKGYNGIYASIFQGADLKATNHQFIAMSNRIKTTKRNEDADELKKITNYLGEYIPLYKKIVDDHRATQLAYNKAIKIEIELYKVD
jgi:hypothetical protein